MTKAPIGFGNQADTFRIAAPRKLATHFISLDLFAQSAHVFYIYRIPIAQNHTKISALFLLQGRWKVKNGIMTIPD